MPEEHSKKMIVKRFSFNNFRHTHTLIHKRYHLYELNNTYGRSTINARNKNKKHLFPTISNQVLSSRVRGSAHTHTHTQNPSMAVITVAVFHMPHALQTIMCV